MQLHLNANCPPNLQDTLVNMVGDFSSGAIYQVQNVDTLVKKEIGIGTTISSEPKIRGPYSASFPYCFTEEIGGRRRCTRSAGAQ